MSKPYSYFDTPDGEDVEKKLWFCLKPTMLVALGISTVDVLVYSRPKTYTNALGRYVYFTAPLVGMTTAFVITTNMANSIRKEDDKINWFLGGCAAGSVFGVWRRSIAAGFVASVAIGSLAMLKKHAVQNDWTLHPITKPIRGSLTSVRQDCTLIRDRPRIWKTE